MTARCNIRVSEGGFTLLEMLVVLSIIGVIAAVSLPLLDKPADAVQLESTAADLASAFRATRAAAILRRIETTLVIDVDKGRVRSSATTERVWPKNVTANIKFAALRGIQPKEGAFRFFPDGSSTGGEVTLNLHRRQTKVCVDWLTGNVRQAQC